MGQDKNRMGDRCHWLRCRLEPHFGLWFIRVKFYGLSIRNIPEDLHEAQFSLPRGYNVLLTNSILDCLVPVAMAPFTSYFHLEYPLKAFF